MDSAGIEKTQGKTDGDSTRDGAQRKTAVLFPGIGYQFDRPLLHFAWEQAAQYGYEVIPVGYSGFPSKIRGNRERMAQSLRMAEEQTEEILRGVDWQSYGRIVFVSNMAASSLFRKASVRLPPRITRQGTGSRRTRFCSRRSRRPLPCR